MERVKVYRSRETNRVWVHPITTPVFTERKEGIYPRLEVRNGSVLGWPGSTPSISVYGAYPWIPMGKVVECFYDKEQRILL